LYLITSRAIAQGHRALGSLPEQAFHNKLKGYFERFACRWRKLPSIGKNIFHAKEVISNKKEIP
jgi:hypothetical protein